MYVSLHIHIRIGVGVVYIYICVPERMYDICTDVYLYMCALFSFVFVLV